MEATGVRRVVRPVVLEAPHFVGAVNTAAVLLLSVVTTGLMASAANVGGEIRHPEILSSTDQAPATEGLLAPRWLSSDFITKYQYSHPWAWKTLETIHFMGLCLLFGVVLVGNMRLLGWMRNAPLLGFHRLLPWGCGVCRELRHRDDVLHRPGVSVHREPGLPLEDALHPARGRRRPLPDVA
jgi:hypothetical protein